MKLPLRLRVRLLVARARIAWWRITGQLPRAPPIGTRPTTATSTDPHPRSRG